MCGVNFFFGGWGLERETERGRKRGFGPKGSSQFEEKVNIFYMMYSHSKVFSFFPFGLVVLWEPQIQWQQ